MSNYITHKAVLESLEQKFPEKKWDEEDVYKWCQQVQLLLVADPDALWMYKNIHLPVISGKVELPSNLYKLIDVFDPETNDRVRYNRRNKTLKKLIDFSKDVIAINFIGNPIDDNCMPLINEDYVFACETFCKINGFENDMLYNKINQNVYFDWTNRFDGMLQGAKGSFVDWGAQEFGEMMVIMGNEIPKIGYQPLATTYYGQDESTES